MAQDIAPVGVLTPHDSSTCRLVVRKEKAPAEVLQFVISGLEMGQQVVVVAGASCLKDLARSLTENGLKAESLIRNGRLICLTAPDCLAQLVDPRQIVQRGPLRRTSSLLRWVTDWSWAYSNGTDSATILGYQRIVHDFVRSVTAVSMCTVHCGATERGSLLAMLADHRRAARPARLPA
jgi:hypothetical protein